MDIPLPHYELIRNTGTAEDPHLIRVKSGVSDGSEAVYPVLGVANHNHEVMHAATPAQVHKWLSMIGNAMVAIQQWRKRGRLFLLTHTELTAAEYDLSSRL